ncbi:MAG: hypothetical protein D8M57_16250 [Candidatus Scalindua sp. AMX11]|nr:MAG: hypothetical protein DWQ00_07020 [Candidatus Scalindua sp.]TDE63819.1 MAG: hypothetical protein D8M57_16250 [Candidatus Scalindua sp. AMX11]
MTKPDYGLVGRQCFLATVILWKPSKHKAFIDKSEMGYSASELKDILSVETKEPLFNLIRKKRIIRKKSKGIYIYFSVKAEIRKRQEFSRNKYDNKDNKLKASIILFFFT